MLADPLTYVAALRHPKATKWTAAALDEYNNLIANGTWEVTSLPPGFHAIGCKWVFLTKYLADGSVDRYKARLVAKGFSQRPGFDYVETFAPTVRMATLRIILALAALENLEIVSTDISQAFINGDLDVEIYMQQPEGFKHGNPGDVLRIRKGLYGLKQAGRLWNQKLNAALLSIGFLRVKADASVYVYARGSCRVIIPIHVDDITLVGPSKPEIEQIISELSQHFKLRVLGDTSWLLGIEIIRDRAKCSLSLSQRQYVVNMLDRFGFSSCSPVSTPMEPGKRLGPDQCARTFAEQQEMQAIPYINAVGALMYLATSTRPDIAFTVSTLARFNCNPGMIHWSAVKHLFRYLKGTLHFRLTYAPNPQSSALFFFSLSYSDSPHFPHHSDTLLVHFHAVVLSVSKIDLDLCCLCSPS
ncbi:hypothetical protein EUX98_g8303 [Antrodiella citrinella]|uniref:Reverse transcriptase Ty1/copia-type domain-containing protein n=1 Tax=Antrodiella citrinella TaxID=2447956 RepID=A0A4S4MA66_9APHY|nr:hypothetical protein EUX98_g8303 [Antrodiella citrinella]